MVPRFLHRYTTPLRHAPVTHVTAFLLLHEISAIVPLFTLAATFHYARWLPPFIGEGKWVSDGVEKFGGYFKRKGWLGEEGRGRYKWWGRGEGGVRVVVEFATAYAVTKALLPLRLIFSVWATPWFARVAVSPSVGLFKRLFGIGRGKRPAPPAAAAGTGVTAGGAVGKARQAAGKGVSGG
ncbi:MAG: hypothetical protein M1832_002811 [Thelocarpon impressellum]|nr:MAG: hypothetical protein M1832_002811 [Thelocarpon impressellum]